MAQRASGSAAGRFCFRLLVAASMWQVAYAAFASIVQAHTSPSKCVAGWAWPEPLPWATCRGFGLSDQVLHLIGLPGDIVVYPVQIWPHAVQSGMYLQPFFWVCTVIHLLAATWLLGRLWRAAARWRR